MDFQLTAKMMLLKPEAIWGVESHSQDASANSQRRKQVSCPVSGFIDVVESLESLVEIPC